MKKVQTILDIGLRYLVWLGLSFLGVLDILRLRNTLVDALFHFRVSGWAIPAIDKWTVFVLGVIWLGIVVWLEDYLTKAKNTRLFWIRSGRVMAILTGILLVTYVL